jgi:hypothetical protein
MSDARQAGSKGECATEGGTVERHIYDPANRLMDSGTTYETFGNTTALPAIDAGGHELTNSYYVDSQVAGQTQNEKTVNYHYDPVGRTEETETIVKGKTESNTIANYAGPGEALTWTSEGTEKWSRNVPGIDGALDAVQTSSGTTTLQLHDLQGNIVGTAALSETETKLLSAFNNTEFGVPTSSNPSKYSWLGANGVSTEFATGIATNGGSSYVPEIGRPLQTGPIASPGAFPDGTGGIGIVQATYLQAAADQIIGTILQNEAAREEATKKETEDHAKLTECPASECGPFPEEEEPGEIYDPEGLASYNTTMNRAQELRADGARGLAVALLLDIGLPGTAEGGADYAVAMETSALSLEACVEIGKGTPGKAGRDGVCFINENVKLGIPLSATAEFCEYKETRQWGKKPHNVYYCAESGEDVWGPWY